MIFKKIFSSAGIYLLANILNASAPFILLPILTRYLEPDEYGQIAMFQMLVSFFGAFTGIVFIGGITRKFYDKDGVSEISEYVGACFQLVILLSILLLALLFIFGDMLQNNVDVPAGYMYIALLVSVSTVLIQLRLNQWQIRGRPVKYGIFQVSASFINLLLSLLLIVVMLLGANGRVYVIAFVSVLYGLIALILLKNDNLIDFFFVSKKKLLVLVKFGFPLIPHVLGIFLLMSVDRWVISGKLGLSQAGIYVVAVQLAAVMSLVFDAANKAYIPWLYERLSGGSKEQKIEIVKFIYSSLFVILIMVLFMMGMSNILVNVLVGQAYSQAADVLIWLAVGQGFRGGYLLMTNFVFFHSKTLYSSAVTIVVGIINLLLILLLVDARGLEGAGIAYTISTLLLFVITFIVVTRLENMPWRLK
jgi:O-antigen/teichoic acid export membrane protein